MRWGCAATAATDSGGAAAGTDPDWVTRWTRAVEHVARRSRQAHHAEGDEPQGAPTLVDGLLHGHLVRLRTGAFPSDRGVSDIGGDVYPGGPSPPGSDGRHYEAATIGSDLFVARPGTGGTRWPGGEEEPVRCPSVRGRGGPRVLLSARPAGPRRRRNPEGPQGPGAPGAAGSGDGAPSDKRVHRNVKLLGVNSLLTDISSESVNSVLPLYLVSRWACRPWRFGIFEGVYQGMSAILRIVGGKFADRTQRHKEVAGAGYALSAATKIGLLASTTVAPTTGVLFVDRIGQGHPHRTPRRPHLPLSPPENLGASFGVHRALDTIGALLGPILAFALLKYNPGAYDSVFVVSLCVAAARPRRPRLLRAEPDPRGRSKPPRGRSLTEPAGRRTHGQQGVPPDRCWPARSSAS